MDYDAEYGAAFLHTAIATGQQRFALSYTVDQELDRNRQMDYADLWLFSGTAEAGAMSGTLRVHLPEIPNEYRAFSRTEDGVDRELAAKMDENGALTVALEQLPAGALIGVRVVYPEGFFTPAGVCGKLDRAGSGHGALGTVFGALSSAWPGAPASAGASAFPAQGTELRRGGVSH